MSFYYENQGTNTYLVYAVDADDSIDSMSLGMLTNNSINGLAPTIYTQMDSQRYIKFNVSAKVSVSQFFAGAVNRKRLLGVFRGIVNAMLAAEDYMLDPASIILDLDYIFTDVSTCETELICFPVISMETKQTDLSMFFRNVMFNTQFDQTENCDYVAKILNYLNSNPVVSLPHFSELLELLEKNTAQARPTQNKAVVPANVPAKTQAAAVPVQKAPAAAPAKQPEHQVVAQPQVPTANKYDDLQFGPDYPSVAKNNATPKNNPVNTPIPVPATSQTSDEKPMSMFYLLQHYNKENAAAYKAQKEAKKRAAAAEKKNMVPTQQVPVQSKAQPPKTAPVDFGFAIPGQAAPQPAAVTPPPVRQPVPAPKTVQQTVARQTPATAPQPQQPTYVPRQMPQGQTVNFGETTVLSAGNIGETTVLSAVNNPAKIIAPHLIRMKNREKISLNKPVFRVGKERSYVDYFIGDNTAISRSHANFITREGEYFVVDTNSTNHTFVNGVMIQSNTETAIVHGDKIRLANEDFEFKLY